MLELRSISYPSSFNYMGEAVKVVATWTPLTLDSESRQAALDIIQGLIEALEGVVPLRFTVHYDEASGEVVMTLWATSRELILGLIDTVGRLDTFASDAGALLQVNNLTWIPVSTEVYMEPFTPSTSTLVIIGAVAGGLLTIMSGIYLWRELTK